MNNKANIEDFVWKKEKIRVGNSFFQDIIKLIDCDEKQLNEFYQHCKVMLYNDSRFYPGRYPLLRLIARQRDLCGVELFLRELEKDGMTRFTLMESLRQFLDQNKEAYKQLEQYNRDNSLGPVTVEFAISGVEDIYKSLPLNFVIDGCLDKLGHFDKQHITLAFILKQGIWFTPQEIKDLTELGSDGKARDRLDVVKERLSLRKDTAMFFSPKGLNYAQLRSMISLTNKKYSDLTTQQLTVLRYRMLYALEDHVKMHIDQWESRMDQIQQVCKHKGYVIK